MIHYRIKVSSMSLGVCQKTWESFKCFQKTLWLDNFLSSISVLSVHSVIDYWYLFFSLAVYHKISTYEFIVSSREQRSEASDVEAGTDKPSSCKRSNKKMFKVPRKTMRMRLTDRCMLNTNIKLRGYNLKYILWKVIHSSQNQRENYQYSCSKGGRGRPNHIKCNDFAFLIGRKSVHLWWSSDLPWVCKQARP